MKTRIVRPEESAWLDTVIQTLQRGGLVAFPTDTVYGIGASAFDGGAVARIYEAKGRREDHPVPVLVAGPEDLDRLAASIPTGVRRLMDVFWPGPLTIIVPKRPDVPEEVSRAGTVGLRAPAHPVALDLLRAAGPLATSSANRSGEPPPTDPTEVLSALGGRVDLLVDGGEAPGGVPSTVVDCSRDSPTLVRAGPISLEAILEVWREG